MSLYSHLQEYAEENGLRDDLAGLCALATACLHKLYEGKGTIVIASIDKWDVDHIWYELGDKKIDLTSGQFGSHTIQYRILQRTSNIEDLIEFCKDWDDAELPIEENVNKVL